MDMGGIAMRKFTRKIAIAILAVLCVPATAFALTTAGENYKAKAATAIEGGTATATVTGEVTLSSFAMQDGAAVRKDTPTGIRFLTDINGSDLAKLPANAEFGTLIMPQTALGENELTRETANVQDVKAKVWYETKDITETAEEGAEPTVVDTLNTFTGVLVGTSAINDFPVAYYNEPIVARSYVTYTDSEENVYTVYAANSQTRSVAYVASAALEDGESDDKNVMKNIVDTVIGDGFSVTADTTNTILFTDGDGVQLTATGNKGLVVTYKSSDEKVLTVSEEGKITVVAAGEASVTATLGTKSFTFTYKVSEPIAQDTAWNIVSEENLTNGMVNFYTNSADTWSSGVKYGTHQQVTVDLLSETNAVGNRTSGLYYKVDPYANFGQNQRFILFPSQEKSVYEAMSDDAVLKFDVYWTILGEHTNTYRQYVINGQVDNKQAVENVWHEFEVPISSLLNNWELIHAPTGNSGSIALFSIVGSYTGSGVTETNEINYWIGNFELVSYDDQVKVQDTAWNSVHPDNVGVTAKYYVNKDDRTSQGLTVDVLNNGNVVGGRNSGAYYKVDPTNENWNVQYHGLTLLPTQEKSVYEAMADNAVLRFDMYFTLVGDYTINQRACNANGLNHANRYMDTWYTFEIPMSTLITNWDSMQSPTDNGSAFIFFLNGNFNSCPGQITFWVGNFHLYDYDSTLDSQDASWAVVHPDQIENDKVQYFVNGGAKTTSGNVVAHVLSDTYQVGDRNSGVYYRVTNSTWAVQNQAITVKPSQDKSVYEAMSENAVLKFDVYMDVATGEPTYQTRNCQVLGKSVSGGKTIRTWHTFEVSIVDILTNWDALIGETKTLFNYVPKYFSENLGGVFYIGNFRVVDVDA